MKLLKLLLLVCIIVATAGFSEPGTNYIRNFRKPETVKIGLLIPDNQSTAARHGAEMAILKANGNGGLNGHPFQLVVRSMEGPWGTGSKQAVNLIFEEDVLAIMGSHDGRNAHLVEQVAAKARIAFLSAWASDPTLSQAFIPWYFSCVPNDLQQAAVLIEEIYDKRKFSKIATLSDTTYDSKLAAKSFLKKTAAAGKPDPIQFTYDNNSQDFSDLLEKIEKAEVSCIVLFGQLSSSKKLVQQIGTKKMKQLVYGSTGLLNEDQLSDPDLKNYENVVFVSTGHLLTQKKLIFMQEYRKKFGNTPGPVASYAYDGMNIIIEAILKAGPDRERIAEMLATTNHEGVTGVIQFDKKGNRIGNEGLMQIKNGVPVAVEK